ncbi:hypothetical protein [Streptomyces cinereoruber]|uniref:hypothetical protein n=1 Tax=Streptomyces cinereoruber TaxID=67260 RepID=UPI003632F7A6
MVKIPWEKLAENPKASEALVTMMLLRLRPGARAVDGKGGDEGRDLYEYVDGETLTLYEAKSFSGRMGKAQRSQVVESLRSAARHQPDHWDLLVPIDPNPSEQRWFDSLRQEFQFVREWRGRSWLDAQFAAHPDLVRYALHESSDYILERIAELKMEREVMPKIPDYIDRAVTLHQRGQEISPHYSLQTELDANGNSLIHLIPKNPGSREGEIRLLGSPQFPAGAHGEAQRRQYEETMRFGGEMELAAENVAGISVSGPVELGLDALPLAGMRIISPREEISPPIHAQLAVQQESGLPQVSVPLEFTRRERGSAGGTLYGQAIGGFLKVRLRLENGSGKCSFTFSVDPPPYSMPQTFVPALRLIGNMRPGRTVALAFASDIPSRLYAPLGDRDVFDRWPPEEAMWWASAFEDLVHLQNRTGCFFPVPDEFTKADARDVRDVLALLSGETITLRGTVLSLVVTSSEALDQLTAPPGQVSRLRAQSQGLSFQIGGQEIELGAGVDTYTLDKVLNLAEARRELAENGQATVRLRVSKQFPATRHLPDTQTSPE